MSSETTTTGEPTRCPLCGQSRSRPLRAYRHAYLVRCGACGLVFAARRPTDAEIASHYETYPRTDPDSQITRTRYRELLASFEPYRQTGRILDVGCGIGFFLEEARKSGWDPHGTEYGARAVEINRSKGLTVQDVSRGAADFDGLTFDVVTAFEVIEHVRDPLHEVDAVRRLLRPGGLFYCTTPNFNSLSRHLLGPRWTVIEYPEHLNYFTPPTLVALLEKLGFAKLRIVTSGLSLDRFRQDAGGDGTPDPDGVADEEPLRAAIERSRALRLAKNAVNGMLTRVGAGDALKGWFQA